MTELIVISPLVIALAITVFVGQPSDISNPRPALSGWRQKMVSVVLISLIIVFLLSGLELIGLNAAQSKELAGLSVFVVTMLSFWGRKRKGIAVIELPSMKEWDTHNS